MTITSSSSDNIKKIQDQSNFDINNIKKSSQSNYNPDKNNQHSSDINKKDISFNPIKFTHNPNQVYQGKHNKFDIACFEGPRSSYKFDYYKDGQVSVQDLKTGERAILKNIEGVQFSQSVLQSKGGQRSYKYDQQQCYYLAIDGKGIGESPYNKIPAGANILNSTKPKAKGSTEVKTGAGYDLLRGTSKVDNLNGGAGNDIFWGSTGSDHINGGEGFDTAAYQWKRDNYYVWKDSKGIHVRDKTRNTGEDILTNIENLRFADGNFAVHGFKFDNCPAPAQTPQPKTGQGGGNGSQGGDSQVGGGWQGDNNGHVTGQNNNWKPFAQPTHVEQPDYSAPQMDEGYPSSGYPSAPLQPKSIAPNNNNSDNQEDSDKGQTSCSCGSTSSTEGNNYDGWNQNYTGKGRISGGGIVNGSPRSTPNVNDDYDNNYDYNNQQETISPHTPTNKPTGGISKPSSGITVEGTGRDDTLTGTNANEVFFGRTGNDKINGGEGEDTAVYTGHRCDYTIWRDNNNNVHVKSNNGINGEDILTGIEKLRFNGTNMKLDKDFKFDNAPNKGGTASGNSDNNHPTNTSTTGSSTSGSTTGGSTSGSSTGGSTSGSTTGGSTSGSTTGGSTSGGTTGGSTSGSTTGGSTDNSEEHYGVDPKNTLINISEHYNKDAVGTNSDDIFSVDGAYSKTINGGKGKDTVQLTGKFADYKVSQDASGNVVLENTKLKQKITLKDVESVKFSDGTKTIDELKKKPTTGGENTEKPVSFDSTFGGTVNNGTLTGTKGNDTLTPSKGFQTVEALGGNDTIVVPPGFAGTIDGGAGNDTVKLEGNQSDYTFTKDGDSVTVKKGNQTFTLKDVEQIQFASGAPVAVDTLFSKTGIANTPTLPKSTKGTTLAGTDGNDRLTISDKVGGVYAKAGNDKIIVPKGWKFGNIDGGEGTDTVELPGNLYDYKMKPTSNGGVVLLGNDGSAITLQNVENVSFNGQVFRPADLSKGSYTLKDNEQNAYNYSGAGQINGNSQNNTIYGSNSGNGGVEIYGKDGNDTLYGGTGEFKINGDAGDDNLYAVDSKFAILEGGEGNDTAYITGKLSDYDIHKRKNGELILTSKEGLPVQQIILSDIEKIVFKDKTFTAEQLLGIAI